MNFLYKICQSSKRKHNNSKSSSFTLRRKLERCFRGLRRQTKHVSDESTAKIHWFHHKQGLISTTTITTISTVCILCESKGWYPLWLCILFAVCAAFNHPMFDNPPALSLWHGIPCRSTCWGMDLHNTRIKRFSLIQKVQAALWSDCKNSFHLYSMSLDSLQMITSDAE